MASFPSQRVSRSACRNSTALTLVPMSLQSKNCFIKLHLNWVLNIDQISFCGLPTRPASTVIPPVVYSVPLLLVPWEPPAPPSLEPCVKGAWSHSPHELQGAGVTPPTNLEPGALSLFILKKKKKKHYHHSVLFK